MTNFELYTGKPENIGIYKSGITDIIKLSVNRTNGGEDLKNKISEYVEKLKLEGMSISEIIEKTGIGRSSFYDIMNGVQVPKLNTANKIATALNTDIKELFPDLNE